MKPIAPLALLLALAAAGPLAPAHAARPFATEDAGALAAAACELEPVLENEQARGEPRVRTTTLQGACGVGAGTQLGLAVQSSRAGDTRARGLGLSGKTQLVEGAAGQASWALAYGGDWQRDAQNKADGKGYTLSGLQAMVVALLPVGGWGTLHANLGWQQQRPEKISTNSWALALEKAITDELDAGVETYGDNREATWWGLGLRWTPTPGVSFNVAASRQTGGPRAKAFSLGGKIDF